MHCLFLRAQFDSGMNKCFLNYMPTRIEQYLQLRPDRR